MSALLQVTDAKVHFPGAGGWLHAAPPLRAVDGVSFDLAAGETLGVVGESGCGKSTLARAVLGLQPLTAGRVLFDGAPLPDQTRSARMAYARAAQLIFQDPLAALNPRMRIGAALAEPLVTHAPSMSRAERDARVAELLEQVGLEASITRSFPHEVSGGQAQRIGIARAMILRPHLLICDEPVASLDVSIQAQILVLLRRLQADYGVAMLFISHDLSVVRRIAHRVMVMYLGRVVEVGPVGAVFANPRHPYTRALIDAVPRPDPATERGRTRILLIGDLPSPSAPPSGCTFRTRCPLAEPACAQAVPPLAPAGSPGHLVACPVVLRENALTPA